MPTKARCRNTRTYICFSDIENKVLSTPHPKLEEQGLYVIIPESLEMCYIA